MKIYCTFRAFYLFPRYPESFLTRLSLVELIGCWAQVAAINICDHASKLGSPERTGKREREGGR